MTWETFPCCCVSAPPDCPSWSACLPQAISMDLSLAFRYTERWNGIVRNASEWIVSADAVFERRQLASGFQYLQFISGNFSWTASTDTYSFHTSSSDPAPCYPCGSSYLFNRVRAVPVVNRPMVAGSPQGQSGGAGIFGASLDCFRCFSSNSPALSRLTVAAQGPFQWNFTTFRENGTILTQGQQTSNVPRYVQVIGSIPGCIRPNTFRQYAIASFGSIFDNQTGGGGLYPSYNPIWWGTGQKVCSVQEKNYGPCFDSDGNPIQIPLPSMSWDVTTCPDELFDTHSCFGPSTVLECGTSMNFPPYYIDGLVSRTIQERVESAVQITGII